MVFCHLGTKDRTAESRDVIFGREMRDIGRWLAEGGASAWLKHLRREKVGCICGYGRNAKETPFVDDVVIEP